MIFKMKKYFFFYAVIAVIITTNGCFACFQEDTEDEKYIQTGSPFFYECYCMEPGYTADNLHWVKMNGDVLQQSGPGTGSTIYTEIQGNALNLLIPSASKSMSDTYKCETTFGDTVHTHTLKVNVYEPVDFIDTAIDQFLIEGNDSLITCQTVGDYNPVVSWYKGITEIDYESGKYLQMPNGLLVRNVSKEDAFIYRCSATQMQVGAEVDKNIKVEVMTIPVIKELYAMPDIAVVAGDKLVIKCEAEGWPRPQYFWNKTSESEMGENSTMTWTSNIIEFEAIGASDAGTYECYASNFVGVDKKQIAIDVYIRPEIVNFSHIMAEEGADIPIYCNATGNPDPNVTIVFEGKSSVDDELDTEFEKIVPNFSMIKVTKTDEGYYECNATNIVGSETKEIYLKVLHRPYFKDQIKELMWGWNGHTIKLSCAHESSPPANISWSYVKGNTTVDELQVYNMLNEDSNKVEHSVLINDNFSPYGIFICRVVNQYGEAVRTIVLKKGFPPSAVQNASTTSITASTATFSIGNPANFTGPDVIGYLAEYDEAQNYNITDIHQNRTWSLDRPFKLERLKPNTTYYVRFAAINVAGTGRWSEMIEFDTLERSAPEPPIWSEDPLKVEFNKHLLKWKAPDDNGDPIDYYVLRYCAIYDQTDEELCKVVQIPPATELALSNLEYNTTYYLELVAHNAEGNSTSATTWITVPAPTPDEQAPVLSAGLLIGISVIIVVICLLLLDVLLFFWRRQGIIASCCHKKNKKKKTNSVNSRDKKGLLKDNRETTAEDTLRRPNNGHKEYEYNKTTGIITGKHSAV